MVSEWYPNITVIKTKQQQPKPKQQQHWAVIFQQIEKDSKAW